MATMTDGFSCEIDSVTKHGWHKILQLFEDSHYCQSWSYGAALCGSNNLSHLILRQNGQITGAAQVCIKRIPVLSVGIAYVKWGPMWRIRGQVSRLETYRNLICAIREEYAGRRKLLLRVMPRELAGSVSQLSDLLADEGFKRQSDSGGTWLIDLSRPVDAIHANLKRKWRACLTQAESRNIEITEADRSKGLNLFFGLYEEMRKRKAFHDVSDIGHFRQIQADLPDPLKLRIFNACYRGEPVATTALSTFGSTGVAVFGATSPKGLRVGASYALDWWIVRWLKQQGHRSYDLGGAGDPNVNIYKSGLAGGNIQPVNFIGKFDYCTSPASLLAVRAGDACRAVYKLGSQRVAMRLRKQRMVKT